MHTNVTLALKPNLMSSMLLCAVSLFKYAFSSISPKIKNLHKIDPRRYPLHTFG